MVALHAQTEQARACPGREDMAQRVRDLLRFLDELCRAAAPLPRRCELEGATATEVEPPRTRGEDDQRPVDVVQAGDDAQRAAAAPAREAQHAHGAWEDPPGRR